MADPSIIEVLARAMGEFIDRRPFFNLQEGLGRVLAGSLGDARDNIAQAQVEALLMAGYAIVPLEPTDEMVEILDDPDEADRVLQNPYWRKLIWRLMVGARPR